MKLKEYPVSLFRALQLRFTRLNSLTASQQEPLPVIVSLTSIPSRLRVVGLTIRSLLTQSRPPEKVVLWLNHELQGRMPPSLVKLQNDRFEIRFADLTCPHRKLIHSVAAFPEKVIVTCDDDLMYHPTWLERLYADHQRHPRDVIAHECRLIQCDPKGQLLPYKRWPVEQRRGVSDKRLMPVGYGGVLYPPDVLMSDLTNTELFMKLAPKADDLWFKAMAYLAGTANRRSSEPRPKPVPIIRSQMDSLKKTNIDDDANRTQWQAICNHYNFNL